MKKFLIIRFSAMGDVVLTSPVVRCLRKKYPEAEIHFLIKDKFREAIASNPHITRLITFKENYREVLAVLNEQQYDHVIDLQRNSKSVKLRSVLNRPSSTFPKLNVKKFLLVNLKVNLMPPVHVVDRYFEAVKPLGVENDKQGLDYFLEKEENLFSTEDRSLLREKYVALVLGATYFTKRIPFEKLSQIISYLNNKVVLLGGPDEKETGERLAKEFPHAVNMAGKTSLQQTSHYLKNASSVITSDTGLMHIAAAFQKRIITVWGSTVPEFGMKAYMPLHPENNIMFEVKPLRCRPCSKLGFTACPKRHFKCMLNHDARKIAQSAEEGL